MNTVIYTCKYGDVTENFLSESKVPLQLRNVYVQDPWDFFTIYKKGDVLEYEQDGLFVQSYELSYFVKMLCEGYPEAWVILCSEDKHRIQKLFDFDILRENIDEFISSKVVNFFIERSIEYAERVDKDKLVDSEDFEEKQYKRDVKRDVFFCIKRLFDIKNIIVSNSLKKTNHQEKMLMNINEGIVSHKKALEYRESIEKDVLDYVEEYDIPYDVDIDRVNEIILKVRNLEIKELSYE